VTGAGIPFVMKWLGFDPAQSSTIFATTITDVVGFFALLCWRGGSDVSRNPNHEPEIR
jgi:Mg/Co/Ni transporter MgtE